MPPQAQAPTQRPTKPTPPPRIPTEPCPIERYTDVGYIVNHYPDVSDGAKPSLAVVTARGIDTIDCSVVSPGMNGMWPFSGVHHRVHQADRADSEGVWLPRPMDVAILKFMLAQGAMEWDGESRYVPTTKAEATPTPPSSPTPPK